MLEMNGVGQQQTRHQGPGTSNSQVSMYIPQNYQATHDNYGGQLSHPPRPNGRPTYVIPQGPTTGPGQRFGPQHVMPMVRNGVPYPSTPHQVPPMMQSGHPGGQPTPGQGDMNMASLFSGAQSQENAQMEFNAATVLYPNMNSQGQLYQTQAEGMFMRPPYVALVRYPQYMPPLQIFQTRSMSVQVPGNAPPNPMQSYQPQHQIVMNQPMMQQQSSEIRQDASTPQSHHLAQFIPNVGFTPDNSPYFFSTPANLNQPPPLMSGQQPMPFNSFLSHGPAPVNQTPIQTPMSQGPSKHGMSKNYIMYGEEYSRSIQQGLQQGINTNTLIKKEKKAIKIIDPSTNKEIDISAPSKSDAGGTFQKQVKEIVEMSQVQSRMFESQSIGEPQSTVHSYEYDQKTCDALPLEMNPYVPELEPTLVDDQKVESSSLTQVGEPAVAQCDNPNQANVSLTSDDDIAQGEYSTVEPLPPPLPLPLLPPSDLPISKFVATYDESDVDFRCKLNTSNIDPLAIVEVTPEKQEEMEGSAVDGQSYQTVESESHLIVASGGSQPKEEDDENDEEEEDDDDNDDDDADDEESDNQSRKHCKKGGKKAYKRDESSKTEPSRESVTEQTVTESMHTEEQTPESNEHEGRALPEPGHDQETVQAELEPESLEGEESKVDEVVAEVAAVDKELSPKSEENLESVKESCETDNLRKVDLENREGNNYVEETNQSSHNENADVEEQPISKSENNITALSEEGPEVKQPANGLFVGRRAYSREFLLNLMNCPEALKKLPTISSDCAEIIRPTIFFERESSVGTLPLGMSMRGPAQGMGSYNDFSSLYSRSSSQQNRLPKRPSQKREFQQQSQQRIINVPLNHDVQIHRSDQAWKPSVMIGGLSIIPDVSVVDTEESVIQKLSKKTRSILNKLTPQNFDTLLKQIKDLPIESEDRLALCMDLVFEKALSEPSYCVAYAKMAHNISTMKVSCKDSPNEFVSFRKLLLNRCQSEFEKDRIDEIELERRQKEIDECDSEEKKKLMITEKDEVTWKARRRSLGNIRFIGELFRMKMLTEKIMFDCLTRLMKTDDKDSIECLCWLLRTIGKELDQAKNKKALDPLFAEIIKKSISKSLSPRTKFMLQDIIDLRANNWVPRRVDVNPKTIEQIHKEAQEEELQRQAMIHQSPLLMNSYPPSMQKNNQDMMSIGRGGGRYHGGPRGRDQVNEEGWTILSSKGGGRGMQPILDHTKLKLSRQNIDESDIKLGPSRTTTWSQGAGSGGSSGSSQFQTGSRHSSQESEKSSGPSANRFAIMGSLGENYDFMSRPNRPSTFKEPSSVQKNQFCRIHNEIGFSSLPLHSRSKNTDRSSRPNSGSRNASRDSSLSREASNRASPVVMPYAGNPSVMTFSGSPAVGFKPPPPVPSGLVKEQGFNKDVFKREAELLVDEYINIDDDKKALLAAQELRMDDPMMHQFVNIVIDYVLEKTAKEFQFIGKLLSLLHNKSLLDTKPLANGLGKALIDGIDFEIDIPKLWDLFAELMASMLMKSSEVFLIISEAIQCLKSTGRAGPLMAKCMLRVAKSQGTQKTVAMWNSKHVSWLLYTGNNLMEFMSTNKLETLLPVASELLLLMTSGADNDAMFSWIDGHVAPQENDILFIRSLVTAACTASLQVCEGKYEMDESIFKRHASLLNRYIDHMPDREVHTLFALQSLIHSLDHPSNILNGFFHLVYDVELISEDAFFEWKSSNDPNEQTGKGVATTATRAFFQWLQDSVEEEDTS